MQFGRVDLVGSTAPFRTFYATGRIAPRLMAGFVSMYTSSDHTVKKEGDSYKLAQAPHARISPMVGLDWAPNLADQRFRMIIATNPLDARHEWLLGASPLQKWHGLQREAIGYDLQIVGVFRRPELAQDIAACSVSAAPGNCIVKRETRFGIGVLFSIDGVGLLSNLMTAFPLL